MMVGSNETKETLEDGLIMEYNLKSLQNNKHYGKRN